MTYNLTFLDNQTNFTSIFIGVNNELDGILALLILVSVFIVMFISMKNYDSKVVLIASSFTTAIISILMTSLSLISFQISLIFVILAVIFLFIFIISKE